jgi:hypothetical protein
MPYADNLYSADSDDESFSDELSPTDGYFSQREHPQDIMVPNPAPESNSSSDSKSQEASRDFELSSERHSSYGRASPPLTTSQPTPPFSPIPSVNTPSATSQAVSPRAGPGNQGTYNESSSLLNHFAPPPTYSVAISQPQATPNQREYSTFSPVQLEEGRFPTPREPESMGGPPEPFAPDERTPLWKTPVGRAFRRRLLKKTLGHLVVVVVIVCLITAMIRARGNWVSTVFLQASFRSAGAMGLILQSYSIMTSLLNFEFDLMT